MTTNISNTEETKTSQETSEAEVAKLVERLKNGLTVKDRKWLLTTYEKCFVASEAVAFMVKNNISGTKKDAVELGKMLLAADIIRHVTNDHDFKDGNLFFRFTSDIPSHGQKQKKDNQIDFSWSDFLPAYNSNSKKENDNTNSNSNNDNDTNERKVGTYQATPTELYEEAKYARDSFEKDVHQNTFGVSPMDKWNQQLLDNVHPVKWVPPKPKAKYNIVAIGAGAAGIITAAGAAGVGGVTAIIEEHLFGGDCLNSGCVPSKALLRAAKVAHDAIVNGHKYGLVVNGTISVDFGKVMERMRRIRAEISHHDACSRFSETFGMDVFLGRAKFISPDTIQVGDAKLKFARCCIATGARASVPPIPGLAECPYITNHTIWNLTVRPEHLGVIGAGPIGCEMAQAFALLGCKVTVMNKSDRIMSKEDPEAAEIVYKSMQDCGCKFVTGVKFLSCSTNKDNSISVVVEHQSNTETSTLTFDRLLVATGRKPNVTDMGLELAKVKYDVRKGIDVNDFLQTSNSNIYAAGDCCTRYQFTHMADQMARIVIRNALFFGRSKVSDLIIPWCTFTFPEVAHVGLYEPDLKRRNIQYEIIKVELSENDRAICDGESEYHGFVKILTKKGTDNILGATIVSNNAGDQISEITLAMQANIGLSVIGNVIHPYPTVSEGIKHAGDAHARKKLTPLTKALLRRVLTARR